MLQDLQFWSLILAWKFDPSSSSSFRDIAFFSFFEKNFKDLENFWKKNRFFSLVNSRLCSVFINLYMWALRFLSTTKIFFFSTNFGIADKFFSFHFPLIEQIDIALSHQGRSLVDCIVPLSVLSGSHLIFKFITCYSFNILLEPR